MGEVRRDRKHRREAATKRKKSAPVPSEATGYRPTQADRWGLGLFFTSILAAALAFGAVDRIVQVCLLPLLGLALVIRPPRTLPLTSLQRLVFLVLVLLFVGKEFLPAAIFPGQEWRASFAQAYSTPFPWTHHPEPGRALDVMLAVTVGALWFLWVRGLASNRWARERLMVLLLLSAGLVAAVSFFTAQAEPTAIYGLRYTQGWMGFGPFPNRNHSAAFFAMGSMIGVACTAWAARRRQWPLGTVCLVVTGLLLAALLRTESRGGLLGLAIGLTVYGALCIVKFRSRRSVAIALAGVLVAAAAVLVGGEELLRRFSSSGGADSTVSRVAIWKDAWSLFLRAPLLGQGAGTFASVFPLFQTIPLDNQVVLHPESSWLQWLVELGGLITASAAALGFTALRPRLRSLFERQFSFFLQAGAVAALAGFLVHCAIDVPGHRWGTAILALAIAGIVFHADQSTYRFSRKLALWPLGIAAFWLLPFLYDTPNWSPSMVARLSDRAVSRRVDEKAVRDVLKWFPLSPNLQQLLGETLLSDRGRLSPEWAAHFQAVARLKPGSWSAPVTLASICLQRSPAHALHFWQMALERAGDRREELLGKAIDETAQVPGARDAWEAYAAAYPELLLIFGFKAPPEELQDLFARWWKERGSAASLNQGELEAFYFFAPRFATPEMLESWMKAHPDLHARDFRIWAAILHARGASDQSWDLLESTVEEPDCSDVPSRVNMAQLERGWRLSPNDVVNAQQLVCAKLAAGDDAGARQVAMAVAARNDAPIWFREKAAFLCARAGMKREAVEFLITKPE